MPKSIDAKGLDPLNLRPEMSFDEIAKALGLAKPTVVVAYHRGIKKAQERAKTMGIKLNELC